MAPTPGQHCPHFPFGVWRERKLLRSCLPKVKPFGVTACGHQGEGITRNVEGVACRGRGRCGLSRAGLVRPTVISLGWAVEPALTWAEPFLPCYLDPASPLWALSGHSQQHPVPLPPQSPVRSQPECCGRRFPSEKLHENPRAERMFSISSLVPRPPACVHSRKAGMGVKGEGGCVRLTGLSWGQREKGPGGFVVLPLGCQSALQP